MLQEMKVKQVEGDLKRRWFADDYFDLIVWLDDGGSIHGFQLCYDKQRDERAMTWTRDHGYAHNRIDSGEDLPTENRSPILVADGVFQKDDIGSRFEKSSEGLEPEIRDLVLEKVRAFSI
jgi:hypothetical protein